MNEQIHSHYIITKNTVALVPSYRSDSYTLVIETNNIKRYVNQKALDIVKASCLASFSSYEGRRQATIFQTGINHKVPIDIYPDQGIFIFPVISPTHYDCYWLCYYHVQNVHHAKGLSRHSIARKSSTKELLIPVSPSQSNTFTQITKVRS